LAELGWIKALISIMTAGWLGFHDEVRDHFFNTMERSEPSKLRWSMNRFTTTEVFAKFRGRSFSNLPNNARVIKEATLYAGQPEFHRGGGDPDSRLASRKTTSRAMTIVAAFRTRKCLHESLFSA
jgi:hypothetical protein